MSGGSLCGPREPGSFSKLTHVIEEQTPEAFISANLRTRKNLEPQI